MDNIFDELPLEDLHTQEDTRDYVAELVGEGKKFKSLPELAKGKYHADIAVEALKKKVDDLQKELSTRTSLESFKTELEKMRNGERQPEVPIPDTSKAMLDPNDLEAKLEALLAQREARKAAETNNEKVLRVLTEQFGDQAKLVINKKAQELGMSTQDMQALASRSPAALFNLLGVSETRTPGIAPVIPQSSVQPRNTPQSAMRGQSYYDRLKASNPKQYFSQETTLAMMKDMETLGMDRFKSS